MKELFNLIDSLQMYEILTDSRANRIKELVKEIAEDFYMYGKYNAENFKDDSNSCKNIEELINDEL